MTPWVTGSKLVCLSWNVGFANPPACKQQATHQKCTLALPPGSDMAKWDSQDDNFALILVEREWQFSRYWEENLLDRWAQNDGWPANQVDRSSLKRNWKDFAVCKHMCTFIYMCGPDSKGWSVSPLYSRSWFFFRCAALIKCVPYNSTFQRRCSQGPWDFRGKLN